MMIIAMEAKTTGSLKSIMHENAVIHTDSGKLVIHHLVLYVHKEIFKQFLINPNDSGRFVDGMITLPNLYDFLSCMEHKRRYLAECQSCTFPMKVDAEQGPPWLDNSFCAPYKEDERWQDFHYRGEL